MWADVTIRNDEEEDITMIDKQISHCINKEEGGGPIYFEQKGEERNSPPSRPLHNINKPLVNEASSKVA